jgi:hypothetical protein
MQVPRYYHTATLLPNGKVLAIGGNTPSENATVMLGSAELYDPATETWSAVQQPMGEARAEHTATLLATGKVLVAGGYGLQSTELFDPETELWTSAGSLNASGAGQSAVLLPSGRVLLLRGKNARLYDPASNQWHSAPTPETEIPRTLTLLPNGSVLLTGNVSFSEPWAETFDPATDYWKSTIWFALPFGADFEPNSATLLPNGNVLITGVVMSGLVREAAQLYDPGADSWRSAGTPKALRSSCTATLLPSGTVLLAGGQGVDRKSGVEIFSMSQGRTVSRGTMSSPMGNPSSAVLPDGRVLIVDQNAEIYSPASHQFTAIAMPFEEYVQSTALVLLPSGKLLLLWAGFAFSSPPLGAAIFDPDTSGWSAAPGLNYFVEPRTATLLPDGRVLVAGGQPDAGVIVKKASIYDPASNSWTPVSDLPEPRAWHTVTLLPSGKVLVAGGVTTGERGDTGGTLTTLIFDPATGTWHAAASMNEFHFFATATLLPDGTVLIAEANSAEIYDPVGDSWRLAPAPGYGGSATLLQNGRVLIAGGYSPAVGPTGTILLYDPPTRTWVSVGSLLVPRSGHCATLLPDGTVLLAGGYDRLGTTLASAEAFDLGDVAATRRPKIVSASVVISYGERLVVSGTRFRGDSEASSGGMNSSAANHPLIQLRSLQSGAVSWLVPDPPDPAKSYWNEPLTLNISELPPSLTPGWHYLTVLTDGMASPSLPVDVTCSVSISDPKDTVVAVGSQATFTVRSQGARTLQWQKDPFGTDQWADIPGAVSTTYTTPAITSVDWGARFRVIAQGVCPRAIATSKPARVTVADKKNPSAAVLVPSGGEYWLVSASDDPTTGLGMNKQLVTWSMADEFWLCQVTVSLVYSNDGGVTYQPAPPGGDLPKTFGLASGCTYPQRVTTTTHTYSVPSSFPSGIPGSLYKIQIEVWDEAGNRWTVKSEGPFYIVQPNADVRTLILAHTERMVSEMDGVSSSDKATLDRQLQDLAVNPKVVGLIVDLKDRKDVTELYQQWDKDASNPARANAVLFGCLQGDAGCSDRARAGIHDRIKELLRIYKGVKYVVLVGDDRIIPFARLKDPTSLVSESTYTGNSGDLTPTGTTVGRALANNMYLSDDPLVVLDEVRPDNHLELSGTLFLPDLAVGRLVETPAEITKTISTFIAQDGVLDLSALGPDGHKVMVTGYDFLQDTATEIRSRWKTALNVTTDNPLAPVDGTLVGGTWDDDVLRAHLAGNGEVAPPLARYGLMSLNGHATHHAEGTPGDDFRAGLATQDIYGPDKCATPSPSQGSLDLSGAVIYAVGCHGGLPVPGSCASDDDHSLDLPQTFLSRGVISYVANTGYGWGLKTGVGYSERLVRLVTDELTSGPVAVMGDAIKSAKLRYFLSTPRFDSYDEKSLMQWASYGLPMYSVKTGIGAPPGSPGAVSRQTAAKPVPSFRDKASRPRSGSLTRRVGPAVVSSEFQATSLPEFLTQVNLHFDLSASGVYQKKDAAGNKVENSTRCRDVSSGGCYYELNGLATGDADLPIQPYLIYDSRLSGTSQHGVLWKGGVYEEESGWVPVRAELQSNGGDASDHGTLPKTIMIRPITPRTVPGVDPEACRASDLEVSSTVLGAGEALKATDDDPSYSIERKYRGIDLEMFYFNNTDDTMQNCDAKGPKLGSGPYAGEYHHLQPGMVEWSVPATDDSGVWRVVVVANDGHVDSQGHGRWTPLELTYDAASQTWKGSSGLNSSRITYVIEAVDNRGNVTWLDYKSARVPSSGVDLEVPRPVEVAAPLPELAINDVTVTEPGTTASALFTVRLSAATDQTVAVRYATRDGTASAAAGDYIPTSGTLSFVPGVIAQTISIAIPADALIESTKDFFVTLASPSNARIGKGRGQGWILDTDSAEGLRFSASSYTVGETSPRATIRVQRVGATSGTATVQYATSDGTAASGVRYTAVSGALTFAPGVALQAFSVPILDDEAVEGPETVLLSLTSASGKAALGTPATAVLTIDDDDSVPAFEFSAADYSMIQGSRAVIIVERTGPVSSPASVHYATSPGTAVAGTNYEDTAGNLSFAAGVRRRSFVVQGLRETADEGDRTVLLGLSNPTGGPGLGTQSTAVLRIGDRDIAGTLQFTVAGYTARESGGHATIKVMRSGGAASGVTVHYATSNGTAVAPKDYTSTAGTLSFDAHVLYQSFEVPIANTGPKGDLTVSLTLSNPTGGATLGSRSTAVLTIQSGQTELEFDRATYVVGETGTRATITVKRTGPVSPQVTVDYATGDGTAKTAQGDYTAASGTLTFGPGVMRRIFTVLVSDDALLEGDETVNLFLRKPQPMGGAFLGVQQSAVLTIRTADPQIQFAKSEFTVSEAASRANIAVVRRPPTKPAVTVAYSTAAGTAVAGTDYVSTSGTLTLASGVTSASFPVELLHDTAQQGTRTVKLTLGEPGNGALLGTPATATLSIGDIDVAGSVQFAAPDFSVSEIGPVATITVNRTGGTASGVTVQYSTIDATGKAWRNYEPTSGTLTFDDGETTKTFTVRVFDDGASDGNKTVGLRLTNPRGGATLEQQASTTLWIVGRE